MGLILDEIIQIMPSLPYDKALLWLPAITSAMEQFQINTPIRQAAFVSQIAHESGELKFVAENLNYSIKGLLATFPKYFPTPDKAEQYARNPIKIANYVYANRMGNGSEASGDGYRYRGRGLIQLTGKENYSIAGKALNLLLVETPDIVTQPNIAALTAAWYWSSRKLNELADLGAFREITKKINGGLNGLEDREKYYERAKKVLGV